ncbi:MAG: phage major capsid protein [Candidatus Hydrogenedentes bacterium]|nr:phage major capsid protein [Candidatus Hydrogenedentota bacterium]
MSDRLEEIEETIGRPTSGGRHDSNLADRVNDLETMMSRPSFGPISEPGLAGAERQEFASFLRTGRQTEIMGAMREADDVEGGYFVHPTISEAITATIFAQSPIRRLSRVETIGTSSFEELVDKDDLTANWVGESEARAETTTPDVGVLMLPLNELTAMPKLTQRMVEDADRDVVAWLEAKVGDKFARTEGAAFTSGNGVNKPRGFLSYATDTNDDDARAWEVLQHVVSGNATAVTADSLFAVQDALRAPYRPGASWLMNSDTLRQIRILKDGSGAYLLREGLAQGAPTTLLGRPGRT